MFPRAAGAAAERVRSHDWSSTPLGPPAKWPASLRCAVELMLNSPESMYLVWGPELIFLFNDAYAPILGPRLDHAMGAPLRSLWADAWPAVREPIEQAFAGQGSRFENVPVAMSRYGVPEDTWWTFSFSPLYGEDEQVAGAFCVTKEVTGMVVAQDRLARENERLIALFEKSPLFMAFLAGPEHRIELVNPGYASLIGHREVIGRPIVEALPEVLDQGYLHLLDEVYRTGEPYIGRKVAYDSGIEQAGSGPRIVDVVFQPCKDDTGRVNGIFVQGLDLTPQVALERHLSLTEARHRQIMDSARDYAIIAFDTDGLITLWNRGAEKILGWHEAEVLGRHGEVLYLAEDRQAGRFRYNMDQALLSGGLSGERWLRQRDGGRFWAHGSMTVLRGHEGEAVGYVVVFRDRTAERHASEALVQSERRLGALVSAATQSLYSISADWQQMRLIYRQDQAADPRDGPGSWREQLIHPEDREAVDGAIEAARGTGTALEVEHRTLLPDGAERWLQMRAVPLQDEHGQVSEWFGAAADITDRRIAQQRLQQLTLTLEERVQARTAELMAMEERLRQGQKMESLGQLTGGIAHDFNNMLTAVSMGLELLELRVGQGRTDGLERYLEMARGGADRAAALTQRLLAFSRRQTLAPSSVHVSSLVSGMLDILSRSIGPSISIEARLQGSGDDVLVDAPQLENALLNLCINARDAMPEGGTLVISSDTEAVVGPRSEQLGLPAGTYVRLSVRDTGTGMDANVLDKVFEPFFTTKPIGQGTGLGLSMIYGFTRQSGGQVDVESAPGQGTTISLYLPQTSAAPAVAAAAAVTGAAGTLAIQGRAVLLVEDEASIRALVRDVLCAQGHRVTEAANGSEALALLATGQAFDLLVTDVGLTGALNGRQVADAGRQTRPLLPVLFITGYAAFAAVGGEHLEPGMEILTKPFSTVELERRVERLLAGDVRSSNAPTAEAPAA
ncbi:PAS domain S-box protein [Stenotrophomonas maltophilia]|uniref:hybrid sensor histidine kinase/response regulator n=1 Tax=Stenotrophomonas maltophilia TaxID=40324 RepID=UPI0039F7008F